MPSTSGPPVRWRDDALARLAGERFDVLVIGGGITGAGVARDAALRGLRVALVEREDFASGTSSRSSRLVHGGVRYLEHGYLHLVAESSRERRILLDTAGTLVKPLKFTWPVYRGARIPRWKLAAGLWLYDLLAHFGNVGRHRTLSAARVLAEEPRLAREGLAGGAIYYDAATDDARLTLATVGDAARAGSVVLNHAEVTSLIFERARAVGVTVRDGRTARAFEVRAEHLVNATGPWTDAISRIEHPSSSPAVLGTKGVHLAVPAARVGNRGAVTLLAPVDQRVMFVLPAGGHTIIGTTDTHTNENPSDVRATAADVRYLLTSVNAFFPAAKLTEDDVVAAWAGIRPLIARGHSGDPAAASREHRIFVGPRGVIAVTGGKLTTYRAMAAEVVDVVERQRGRPPTPCTTATRALPDDGWPAAERSREAAPGGEREGSTAPGALLVPGLPYTVGDVVRAVEREFACTIGDVLVRRTHVAFETRDHGSSVAPQVAALLAPRLAWTEADRARALDDYRAEVARLFTIEP